MDPSKESAILKVLSQSEGACSLESLSKQLYLSLSTVRRVCIALEQKGLVERYHGGVALVQSSAWESPISKRSTQHQAQKAKIARLASKLLRDNLVIFMDSSSTVQALSPYLQSFHNITVITNDIYMAQELSHYSKVQCYICPGIIKPNSSSVVGSYSLDFLSNFRANIAFVSCKAIDTQGVLEGDDQQAFIKRMMIRYAKQVILLCDSSKQNEDGFFRLCGFDKINTIITDAPLDASIKKAVSASSCDILIPQNNSTTPYF